MLGFFVHPYHLIITSFMPTQNRILHWPKFFLLSIRKLLRICDVARGGCYEAENRTEQDGSSQHFHCELRWCQLKKFGKEVNHNQTKWFYLLLLVWKEEQYCGAWDDTWSNVTLPVVRSNRNTNKDICLTSVWYASMRIDSPSFASLEPLNTLVEYDRFLAQQYPVLIMCSLICNITSLKLGILTPNRALKLKLFLIFLSPHSLYEDFTPFLHPPTFVCKEN